MKIMIMVGLLTLASFHLTNAKDLVEKFTVYGNCGKCKKTIESSLKNTVGIKEATWDKKTKILTVKFDDELTNLNDVKQRIADAGYDSDEVRASDDVYESLHHCCKYDRPEKKRPNDN